MSIDELVKRTNFTKDELTAQLHYMNISFPTGFVTEETILEKERGPNNEYNSNDFYCKCIFTVLRHLYIYNSFLNEKN